MGTEPSGGDVDRRRTWMRTLALAPTEALQAAWERWEPKPAVHAVRGPEVGLVMVRGRVGSRGDRFNLGEATVARATVRLHGGTAAGDVLGSSYVLGTDLEHARLAAVFDGLLADDAVRDRVLAEVVAPLDDVRSRRDAVRGQEARSTQVDFFTVSREHA